MMTFTFQRAYGTQRARPYPALQQPLCPDEKGRTTTLIHRKRNRIRTTPSERGFCTGGLGNFTQYLSRCEAFRPAARPLRAQGSS